MKLTKSQAKILDRLEKNTQFGMPWLYLDYRVDGPRLFKAAQSLVRIGVLKDKFNHDVGAIEFSKA